jgi:hypothetical protein
VKSALAFIAAIILVIALLMIMGYRWPYLGVFE